MCVFQLDDPALKHLQKHCPELMTINMQSCTVRLLIVLLGGGGGIEYFQFSKYIVVIYIMTDNEA